MVGWLVVWVLWHINLCKLFNAKSIFKHITSCISNNSVKHKYTVQLSKTFLLKAIQFSQTVLTITIQFSISIVFVYTQLNVKTVLFPTIQFSIVQFQYQKIVLFWAIQFSIDTQFKCKSSKLLKIIQFSISTQFSSIWPKDRNLSGATTLGQNDGNEGVLRISLQLHCVHLLSDP